MAELGNVLIVGCGNMGGAMLSGWLAAGLAPGMFTIVDPVLAQAPAGVRLLREPEPGMFDVVLLGVKPQMLAEVAPAVEPLVGPRTILVSMLAGVELATLAKHFPRAIARVRLMPNLAASLGKSPLALAGKDVSADHAAALESLLAPLGHVEWLPGEDLFDLVTALAGSGPAFVYRFIDALAQAAAALGMGPEQAGRLAIATVGGAVSLAVSSEDSPGELARKVASPGGTTEAGLKVLDDGQALARLLEATLRAARDRGAEMAAQARRGS